MSRSREPKLRNFEFNREKFEELIVYIAERCADDPTYDTFKLNTMLYYADFAAYRMFGEPISGATYEKYSAGPVAKQLPDARRHLMNCGQVKLVERRHFLGGHRQLVPAQSGELSSEGFSLSERQLLDSIIEFFAGKSAREVSSFVQHEPGWAVTHDQETIPYESGWLRPNPHDPSAEDAARQYARTHGYL